MAFVVVLLIFSCLYWSSFCQLFVGFQSSMLKTGVFKHINCRNNIYPKSNIKRFSVPDEFVCWSQAWADYVPPAYTAAHINTQIWADPDIDGIWQAKWNSLDGAVNRTSHNGLYKISNGYPLNPIGRTGLCGRGLLGRWGPNHAADPIVTRWKRNINDNSPMLHAKTQKQILQMVAIQRNDNKMWAIPGGMVDPGENVSATLKREFMEEALNSLGSTKSLEKFFATGHEVYKGYVDDYRNTDNAWIETIAMNFHDDSGCFVGKLELVAGDDAGNVRWQDIDSSLKLHANHIDMIKEVAKILNAHW